MPIVNVVEVVKETSDAHTFILAPADGSTLSYLPGQFLTVRIPTDRPEGAARCYSACTAPGHDDLIAVTVKRTRDGYASNWLCDQVGVGSQLEVLAPAGTFTPQSLDHDLLLLAGGSGVTPVMSILKSVLLGGQASVTLVYANRHEESVIFRDQLNDLVGRFPDRLQVLHWLESVQGLPTVATLRTLLRPYAGRESFVCGPGAFMDVAVASLASLDVPKSLIHVEKFTSLEGDPFEIVRTDVDTSQPSASAEVILFGTTHTVRWPWGNKLLDVLLAEGINAPYSCREGACSACACILEEGEVTLEHNEVLEDADLAEGIILGCQALPVTDRLRINFDA